jgi:hypothetical protein
MTHARCARLPRLSSFSHHLHAAPFLVSEVPLESSFSHYLHRVRTELAPRR